jgi:hypothetical protein
MNSTAAKELNMLNFPVCEIVPTTENANLYNQFTVANADDRELVKSIREAGILTPLHISQDGYLLDGHRRHAAAKAAGLATVPVMIVNMEFEGLTQGERLKVLRAYNHHREKSFDERCAEALAEIDPEAAYRSVLSYRADRATVKAGCNVVMGKRKERAQITTTKFLDAVIHIVEENRWQWPISNRAIHYQLLNNPPLTHDAKPTSHYRNEKKFADKLSSLLTRARIDGIIPMEAICDEERGEAVWTSYQTAAQFIEAQHRDYLQGYTRDLLQSQPHHIEIIVEKRTKFGAIKELASGYTIPVTAGKGYASLAPRYHIAERYLKSGKHKLILIFATDFDPDGEQIAASFARSMRDDFHINNVVAIKAALTAEQVMENDLPSSLEAKATSPNYKRFVAKHGTRAVELDAMPSELLEQVVRDAIHSVLDVDAFNAEVEMEKQESAQIAARRKAAFEAIGEMQS